MNTSTRLAFAVSCTTALLACSESIDSRSDGLAVYQNGAAPVAPWALADDGAGTGDEPVAPGMNGINPGGTQGAAGTIGMMTGTGGMSGTGSGGMSGVGTGGITGTGTGGTHGAGTGGMSGTGTAGITGGGTGGMMEPTTNAPPTGLAFDVTTVSQGGRYQPANIGAIWVQDSSGKYIKTLEVWATIRAIYLSKWLSVNPWGEQTDAISGATLRMHKAHHATWDLTDSNGAKVPDGDYEILVESTDQDFPGDSASIKFTKGPKAQTVMPSDETSFTALKLVYQ